MFDKQDPRTFSTRVDTLRDALRDAPKVGAALEAAFPGLARALAEPRSQEFRTLTAFADAPPTGTQLRVGPMKDHEPIIICVF